MPNDPQNTVEAIFHILATEAYTNSKVKGFWRDKTPATAGAEKIALMHSELSEALEAMRTNNWIGEKGCVEEELADTVIRILDFAGAARFNLGRAILDKMAKNAARPAMHGKQF